MVAGLTGPFVPAFVKGFVPGLANVFVPGFAKPFVAGFAKVFVPGFVENFAPGFAKAFVPGFAKPRVAGLAGSWVPVFEKSLVGLPPLPNAFSADGVHSRGRDRGAAVVAARVLARGVPGDDASASAVTGLRQPALRATGLVPPSSLSGAGVRASTGPSDAIASI